MNDKDTIYRQEAIDTLFELYEHQRNIDPTEAADLVRQGIYLAEKKIEQLPSTQPKRGYWIESHEHIYVGNGVKEWTNWYCSECDAPNDKPTDFCPNCGVRIERETNV